MTVGPVVVKVVVNSLWGRSNILPPISGADLELTSPIECDITEDQLATVLSLKGATKPDGSIHEER